MEPLSWTTEKRKIKDLLPYGHNPRVLTKDQAEQLKKSLEKFNLVEIPAIDTDNRIVAGHQRLSVMKLLGRGEEEIDVRVPNRKLTDEEFKEYNIRSNRNTGEWDWEELAGQFDFGSLVDFGFEVREIEKLFDIVKEDEFDIEAELKTIIEPKVTQGDVWLLNRHRLVCGDSTKEEDVAKLMSAEQARLIFIDPPYNVNYLPQDRMKLLDRKRHTRGYGNEGIFQDNMSDSDYLKFMISVLQNLHKYSTDDCTIYCWFGMGNVDIVYNAFRQAKWHISQVLIWVKNYMLFSRGVDYHRMYEPVIIGWKEKKAHFKNRAIVNFKDVFNLDFNDFLELLDIWYEKRDNVQSYIHPTQKPVRLAERAIKKNSEINDLVVDVFGGSGSTLMACEQMNRRCNSMELDPKFVHATLNRWRMFTGDEPVRQRDNKTWSEVKDE